MATGNRPAIGGPRIEPEKPSVNANDRKASKDKMNAKPANAVALGLSPA